MRAIVTYRTERGWTAVWATIPDGRLEFDGPPADGESSLDAHANALDRTFKTTEKALERDMPQTLGRKTKQRLADAARAEG